MNFSPAISLLFLSALFFTAACSSSAKEQKTEFVPLPENSDTEIAQKVRFLSEVIKDNPSADLLIRRAKLQLAGGKEKLAESDAEAAFLLDSNRADLNYLLAQIYTAEKEYDKSWEYVLKAEKLDLGKPDFYYFAGKTALQNRKFREAAERFDRAEVLRKNDPEFYFLRGTARSALSDTLAAAADFTAALRLKKEYLEVYRAFTDLYLRSGNSRRAAEYAVAGLQIFDSSGVLHYKYGQALAMRHQRYAAVNQYVEAVKYDSTIWQAAFEIFKYKVGNEDYRSALQYLVLALNQKPDIPGGQYQVGFLYEYKFRNYEKALDAYLLAGEQSPGNKNIALLIDRVQNKIKRKEEKEAEALRLLLKRQAAREAKENPEAQ